jgi:hypothetical protein
MPNISPIVLKGAIASLDSSIGVPPPCSLRAIFNVRVKHELDRARRIECARDSEFVREVASCS